MQENEKQDILRLLAEGSDALHAALTGVDEELARRKPAAENWSIRECVEHLALSEAVLLARLREAKACSESHEDCARETKFQNLALNRGRRIEAPETVTPAPDAMTLAQAVDHFQTVRRETVRFVEEFSGALRWSLTSHPLITKPVNCYEMLLLMALHPKRHALQIIEAREAARCMTESD